MTTEGGATADRGMIRQGMARIAAGNFLTSSAVCLLFAMDALNNLFFLTLFVGAVGGATVSGPFLWRALAVRKGRCFFGRAAIAGALSVVAANISMWLVYGLVTLIVDYNAVEWPNAVDYLTGLLSLALLTLLMLAYLTLPLGILVAILVTFWCRSQSIRQTPNPAIDRAIA